MDDTLKEGGPNDNPSTCENDKPGDVNKVVPRRGRPRSATKKRQVTIRLSQEILEFYQKIAEGSDQSISQVIIQALMDGKALHTTASAAMFKIEDNGIMALFNKKE